MADVGVFNHIVEDRRRNRFVIKVQLGKDSGNSQWMVDIGFTAQAALAFME